MAKEIKLKKYEVSGRIRADIDYTEIVTAKTEAKACKLAEAIVLARCGLNEMDIIDDEQYCEKIKE